MVNKLMTFCAAATLVLSASTVSAAVITGDIAPDFTATDANGDTVRLSDYTGKTVVLEWHNPGCPFVEKFYQGGNMQAFQRDASEKGVIWLTINSSAEGKQGYFATGTAAKEYLASANAAPTKYLLDTEGTVGHQYAAKTTPHMYVIDGSGKLIYQGAIDDKATADSADIASAKNYVLAALEAAAEGKMPEIGTTQSYGCSVKYQ